MPILERRGPHDRDRLRLADAASRLGRDLALAGRAWLDFHRDGHADLIRERIAGAVGD